MQLCDDVLLTAQGVELYKSLMVTLVKLLRGAGGNIAPGEGESTPVEGKCAPVEGESTPVEGKCAAGEGECAPEEGKCATGEGDCAAGGECAPGEGESAPGEGECAPGEGKCAPREGEFTPGDGESAAALVPHTFVMPQEYDALREFVTKKGRATTSDGESTPLEGESVPGEGEYAPGEGESSLDNPTCWILRKPYAFGTRGGRLVTVQSMRVEKEECPSQWDGALVQRYITTPMLIDGHKFSVKVGIPILCNCGRTTY
eukprot:1164981-Prorocentrum_minimum.AAC.3